MKYESLVKAITKETNLVMIALALDSRYQTAPELQRALMEGFGYETKRTMAKSHPYFGRTSIKDSLEASLSSAVNGNKEKGWKLKEKEKMAVELAGLGIKTVNEWQISLAYAFGGDLSANNVAEILYYLRDGETRRIQDICDETGISYSVPGKHLARLDELGIVIFKGYVPPRFKWAEKVASFNKVEENIAGSLPFTESDYRIHRAVEVARRMYNQRPKSFDLSGVEKLVARRFAIGGYSRNITAGALRSLERLGYLEASNNFSMGSTNSQVSAVRDEKGNNPLIDYVTIIRENLKFARFAQSWNDAITAIEVFDSFYQRKRKPEDLEEEIIDFLAGRTATRKEIEKGVKRLGLIREIHALEDRGIVTHHVHKNRFYYSLKEEE